MTAPVVAIVGTRFEDFRIEEEVLGPLGATFVDGGGASADELVATAANADVVLAGSAPRFDARVIAELSAKAIVRYGIGIDKIDVDAARDHGKWVVRITDYGTDAVATHAVTLALAGIRRLVAADDTVRRGSWGFADLRPLHLPSAQTAGVVGFGRIGRRTGQLLAGLGFDVVAYDPFTEVADSAARPLGSLEELLDAADVVSLHAPGAPSGKPLLDAAMLERMRDGSVLVNTARGALVDLDALVAGLAKGRPGHAALDVFPSEPPEASIFDAVADRVTLTPHMAWYTAQSEADVRRKAALEARRILEGHPPLEAVVDPTVA